MISIFKDVFSVDKPHYITLEQFVKLIKTGGKHKDHILHLRTLDKQARDEAKKRLPQILLAGTFSKQNADSCIAHSGLIPLDFDGISKSDILKLSPYIYMAWDSPSGLGTRAIVRVPPISSDLNLYHGQYFSTLKEHFNTPFWDDNLKSLKAGTYLSYDPDIYINEQAPLWTKLPPIKVHRRVSTPLTDSGLKFDLVIKWLTDHGDTFTNGSRNAYLFKLASALCRAGVPQPDSHRLLSQYQETTLPLKEINSLIHSAYKTNVFNSWNPETNEVITIEIPRHAPAKDPILFWLIKKEKTIINRAILLEFLVDKGFRQLRVNKDGICIYIQIVNNIVYRVDKVLLSTIIRDHILKFGDPDVYETFLRGADAFLSESMLRFLPVEDIHWNADTKSNSWIYFSNTAVCITKDEPLLVPYAKLPGCIWESQLLTREFSYIQNPDDFQNCEFSQFISLICGGHTPSEQSNDKILALMSVSGFLLHSYKDPTKPNAIVFTDEVISDNPQGGTGKGIYIKSILKFRKHHYIDGKSFTFDRSFLWMGIDLDTKLVVMDDLRKNFEFERLFSAITEGLTIENKGKNSFYIPFDNSPKFILTANSALRGEGNSHERRKLEIEFSNFFNKENNPQTYFGHHLYDDWNQTEWLHFDNFMVFCLQLYFQHGLISPKSKNIEYKKLVANTSSEFLEWASDNIIKGKVEPKRQFYELFVSQCPEQKRFTSSARFYGFVSTYCAYYKIPLTLDRYNSQNVFKFGSEEQASPF